MRYKYYVVMSKSNIMGRFCILNSYQKGAICILNDKTNSGVFIPFGSYKNALPNDIVEIDLTENKIDDVNEILIKDNKYKLESYTIGSVIKVITPYKEKLRISGILNIKSNTIYSINKNGTRNYLFKPSNPQYPTFVVGSRANPTEYKKNVYILVELIGWNTNDKHPKANCCDIIGEIGIIENEITNRLYTHNLIQTSVRKYILDLDIKAQSLLCADIINKPLIHGRLDLTDKYIFSIDPPNCLDVDDAIHIDIKENVYQIGIHIADVSEWVHIGSNLDLYAKNRLTSIYLPNNNIPMLPTELSENHCSLLEGVKRLSLSLILDINLDGIIIDYHFIPTIIQNKNKMTYDYVEKQILLGHKLFNQLLSLTNKMAINYHINKYHINDIESPNSHSIVETCMILANMCCGQYLTKYDKNSILRVHQISKLINLDNVDLSDKILSHYIKTQSQNSAEYAISSYLKSNTYSVVHDGLGIANYTHFTSPIRRYIDLINHRTIKEILKNPSKFDIIDNDSDYKFKQTICASANTINKKTKKLYRDIAYLNLINQLEIKGEAIKLEAYIVQLPSKDCSLLESSKISIYIPQYNIKKTLTLCHHKIIHLYDIKNNNKSLSVVNKSNGETVIYNLYDKINVIVTSILNTDNFNEKLKIEIPKFSLQ